MTGVWDSDDWRDYLEIDEDDADFFDDEDTEGQESTISFAAGVSMIEDALCAFAERSVLPLLATGPDCDPERAYALVKAAYVDLHRDMLPYSVPDEALAPVFWDTFREAEDLLRAGLTEDAAHRLRLLTAPKFKWLPACVAAYGAAIGEVWGPPAPEPWQFALFSLPPAQDSTP